MSENRQHILVFQQNNSGEAKVKGIRDYGNEDFYLEEYSIDRDLPELIDETAEYLPEELDCDLVLDYLRHPDLSADLAEMCSRRNIPVVASGKKLRTKGVFTPFT